MDLLQAWARTCAARGAVGDVTGAGVRLLAAYRSPQRVYHDAGHLHEVLAGVDELSVRRGNRTWCGWRHGSTTRCM